MINDIVAIIWRTVFSNGLSVPNSSGDLVPSDQEYPLVSGSVDGLTVRNDVPNTSSIGSSFSDPEVLPGIRIVSLDGWDTNLRSYFYAADDFDRVNDLAQQIQHSGEINPLIVGLDDGGDPYIVEGLHRLGALIMLKKRAFPAMVVKESSDIYG
jgi:hypothetical protein